MIAWANCRIRAAFCYLRRVIKPILRDFYGRSSPERQQTVFLSKISKVSHQETILRNNIAPIISLKGEMCIGEKPSMVDGGFPPQARSYSVELRILDSDLGIRPTFHASQAKSFISIFAGFGAARPGSTNRFAWMKISGERPSQGGPAAEPESGGWNEKADPNSVFRIATESVERAQFALSRKILNSAL
jgi:hypothetical protein